MLVTTITKEVGTSRHQKDHFETKVKVTEQFDYYITFVKKYKKNFSFQLKESQGGNCHVSSNVIKRWEMEKKSKRWFKFLSYIT